jgi:parallel beta-helix repeat protein
MKRKYLTIGVILLFVATCINPSTGQKTEQSSLLMFRSCWLYVGGTGPGNYSKIQEAINNAYDGDVIFVFAGIYYENLIVDKILYLIGETAESTIIDGQQLDQVIKITADMVTIERFTIQNSSCNPVGCYAGILVKSNYTTISNNIIIDNFDAGIYLEQVSEITIRENNISNNCVAIFCYQSHKNIITTNDIYNNSINLQDSSFNQIKANKIHQGGILLFDSKRNNIQDNAISSKEGIGIYIYGSPWNIIQLNTIEFSKIGIFLMSCSNMIRKNLFKGNTYGIILEGAFNNRINQNNFLENQISADFSFFVPLRFFTILERNYWIHNYWDDHPSHFPRLISGTLTYPPDPQEPWNCISIPWAAIDWLPARELFDIKDKS